MAHDIVAEENETSRPEGAAPSDYQNTVAFLADCVEEVSYLPSEEVQGYWDAVMQVVGVGEDQFNALWQDAMDEVAARHELADTSAGQQNTARVHTNGSGTNRRTGSRLPSLGAREVARRLSRIKGVVEVENDRGPRLFRSILDGTEFHLGMKSTAVMNHTFLNLMLKRLHVDVEAFRNA